MLIVLALFLTCVAVYNIFSMLGTVSAPYPIDYSEGILVAMKLRYLYKSFNSSPFLITYYPPLYYLFIVAFRSVYHANTAYFYTRVLSLLGFLADALMVYLITRKIIEKGNPISIFAPLLFLSSPMFYIYGLMPDPTPLELLFVLIGLFFLVDYKHRSSVAYSALAFVIAFFLKQDALVIFIAAAAWLLIKRKYGDLVLFAGVFLAVSLPITLVLDMITNGRYVFSLFILPIITTFSMSSLVYNIYYFILQPPFAIFVVLASLWISKNSRSLISIVAAFSVIIAISSGKIGATEIYFFTPLSIFCIAAAAGLENLSGEKRTSRSVILGYTLTMFLIIWLVGVHIILAVGSQSTNIYNFGLSLRGMSGNILAENPDIYIAANKSMTFESSEFWAMQEKGLWNDSQIVDSINNHNFSGIAVPSSGFNRFMWYPDITNAINSNYHIGREAYNWTLYIPN